MMQSMMDHQLNGVLVLLPAKLLLLLLLVVVQPSAEALTLKDSFSDCSPDDLLSGIEVQPSLAEHSKEFDTPTVTKVTDGVYVAVGYALANAILLEGEYGAVIVDVTESVDSARTILADFRKHTTKPITDIVFTHNHGDHVFGAEGFIEDSTNPPDIWAHHSFSELVRGTHVAGPKLFRGVMHQMGVRLGTKYIVNSGLGPRFHRDLFQAIPSMEPNRLVYGDVEEVFLEAAGLNLTFIHIPGETEDQIAVWLPDKRVLLPADDLYKTFPNLYAIRGTPPRNSMTWHDSLRRMRDLEADYLVPSHTQPVEGRQRIHDILTTYMAAIRYVHDQTIRYMNRGLHPDDIASHVKQLPGSLASERYLQQFYGTTVWSSKGVYENEVGWFSGDPVELLPLGPTERSERMLKMMGTDRLLAEAEAAFEEGQLQWALELVSYVFRVHPGMKTAEDLRLKVLRGLAAQQTNPIARNFYMTTILSDHGLIDWEIDRTPLIEKLAMAELFDLMRYKVKAEVVDGVNLTIVIHFTDTRESYRLRIVYSVLDVELISTTKYRAGGGAERGAAGAGGAGGEADGEPERAAAGAAGGGAASGAGGRAGVETARGSGGAGGTGGEAGGAPERAPAGGGAAAGGAREGAGVEAGGAPEGASEGATEGAPEGATEGATGGATGGASEGAMPGGSASPAVEEYRWDEAAELGLGAVDVQVVTTSDVWRQVMAKKRSIRLSIESGEIHLHPNDALPTLIRFIASFDTS